ncbi:flagellar cap protein FliD [Clostridium botulinum]|nr:flagellar cap protein FliD [Clostridium botulinum]
MRITGMATGLDMDEIIKNSMKPYRIKVDQMTQKKDVVEIKQKLYRDIMSDASKFYDKYFDLTKSDSLLKSSNYKSVSFTSSSDAVKVTAGSSAKAGNYEITGSIATGKKAIVNNGVDNGDKIVINGKEFTLNGVTANEREKDLNKQLKDAGIDVKATYTELTGNVGKPGLVLECNSKGVDGKLDVGGNGNVGIKQQWKEATTANITGISLKDIKDNNGKILIGDKEINLSITDDTMIKSDLEKELKNNGFEGKVKVDSNGNITITSTTVGSGKADPNLKIGDKDAKFKDGTDSTASNVTFTRKELGSGSISVNGNKINIPENATDDDLKTLFEAAGLNFEISDDKITLTSKINGSTGDFDIIRNSTKVADKIIDGKDGNITITDKNTGLSQNVKNSNTITLDGVTFTLSGEIPKDGIKITGKNDVTETKDKLVNFINDYNTLMEKLNTLTMTKHDKGYAPLTAEQKKEMSESEIKLWNERVEKGQLYKDSDLTRISNSLKSTMRTVMDGTGLNLGKIGIEPLKDYSGTKNGTFTIDESKLTAALEEDIEGVMNLFIGKPEEGDKTTSEYTSKTGVLHQLNDTLKKEFKTSTSSLSKKVGMEGTSTFTNNALTKSMSDYEKKIKDMEKSFSRREQALYSKYATLEKMMNNLNSQQSNLMSQLGMS